MKPINLQFSEITRREYDVKNLNKFKHLEAKKSKELVKVKILKSCLHQR